MAELPPELEGFAALLDAQPGPVREIFQYCLCLMMVEAGKMQLVEMLPGEASAICVFKSSAGETFSVARPTMSQEEEAEVITVLGEILTDGGMV
jgi:hypothetical protein